MQDVLDACREMDEKVFSAGQILLREGGKGRRLFVLISGTVTVWRGEVRVSRVDTPGALFGEMSALLDMPYSASVQAETEVRVRVVEDGPGFLSSSPAIALHAARLLAQRLYDATTYLADVKRQYEDEAGHVSFVERILGTLLNQQRETDKESEAAPKDDDPRL